MKSGVKIDGRNKSYSDSGSGRSGAFRRHEVECVIAGSIAFALLFGHPILHHLDYPGALRDWDLFREMAWVGWKTVVDFHQLPVWNPYLCGGIPLMGDPQSSVVTPLFAVHLIFGPVVGMNLEILFHLAIAWAGGYVLARVLGLGTLAAVTCATIFPASSWFYLHVAVGHHVFMPATYLPWVLALAVEACERRRLGWASLAGLFLGLIFLEGAPHVATFALLLLVATPAGMRLDKYSLLVLGTVIGFAATFAAIKLLPTYAFVAQHPRPGYLEYFPIRDLAIALYDRNQYYRRPGLTDYNFWEAGAYLSPSFLSLAIAGAVLRWRSAWRWILAAAVMLTLAMGNFSRYAPWTLLHQMPPFSSERIAIRLLIPFVLCAGVVAAYGVDALERFRPPWSRVLAAILVAAGAIDALLVGPPNLATVESAIEQAMPAAPAFRQFRAPKTDSAPKMLRISMANLGITNCYEYTTIPTPAVGYNQPDYLGEQHLLGSGNLQLVRWTPNALSYAVDAAAPTTVVINQNFDRGWTIAQGSGRLISYGGLLAIEVPAGHQQLTVRNLGDGLIGGFAITLMAAFGAVLLWWSGL